MTDGISTVCYNTNEYKAKQKRLETELAFADVLHNLGNINPTVRLCYYYLKLAKSLEYKQYLYFVLCFIYLAFL